MPTASTNAYRRADDSCIAGTLVFRGRLRRVLVIDIAQIPELAGGKYRKGALVRARCKGCSYDAECSADYTADVHTLLCANHRSLRKKQVHALTFACALLLRSCRGNAAVIEAGLVEVRARTLHAVFAIDDCGVYVRIGMLCALSPLSVKYMLCVLSLQTLCVCSLCLNIVCVLSLSSPFPLKILCVCVLSLSILCVLSLKVRAPPTGELHLW